MVLMNVILLVILGLSMVTAHYLAAGVTFAAVVIGLFWGGVFTVIAFVGERRAWWTR